jgi:hypothetical protein
MFSSLFIFYGEMLFIGRVILLRVMGFFVGPKDRLHIGTPGYASGEAI